MAIWKHVALGDTVIGTPEVFSAFDQLEPVYVTNTQVRYEGDSELIVRATGTGFVFGDGVVTGGTATKLVFSVSGTAIMTVTELSVDMAEFSTYTDAFSMATYLLKGNDEVYGTDLGESLYAFAGRDLIAAGKGQDSLFGGDDNDTLWGQGGNDQLAGEAGVDILRGGNGNDGLAADSVGPSIASNTADSLYGGAGKDQLLGNAGDNLLNGGLGADGMLGGDGADRFIFDTALGAANADTINDFVTGEDKIVLDNDIFRALTKLGGLGGGKFVVGAEAVDANDRIIYDANSGKVYYDRDGSGAAGQQLIFTVQPDANLKASDFLIIN